VTRNWIHLAGLAVTLVAAGPVESQVRAQVAPVKYNVTVRPGKPMVRDVLVSNEGDYTAVVRIRLSDWTMDENGAIQLAPPGSTPHSLAGRVQYEPTQFSLGPGESQRVHVTMTTVEEGPATRWGVLLSEVRPAVFNRRGFGPRAIAELGTTIYLSRVAVAPVFADVTNMTVTPLGGDSLAVAVRVRNTGERHFYVAGEMALSDSSGQRIEAGNLGTGVVLPGAEREFTWTCASGLQPGHYMASAVLDTGEPELVIGETWFQWPARPFPAPSIAGRNASKPAGSR